MRVGGVTLSLASDWCRPTASLGGVCGRSHPALLNPEDPAGAGGPLHPLEGLCEQVMRLLMRLSCVAFMCVTFFHKRRQGNKFLQGKKKHFDVKPDADFSRVRICWHQQRRRGGVPLRQDASTAPRQSDNPIGGLTKISHPNH